MKVGERVKQIRAKLDMTQKELAEKVGTEDVSYIGKVERGDQWPSLKYLSKIALSVGKPLVYFFENEREEGTRETTLRSQKIKTIACLISKYNWELADFRKCRRACNGASLCKVIKVVVNH